MSKGRETVAVFEPDLFWKFLAALLALLNPLYGIPVFLSLTEGYTETERHRTAAVASAAVTATALLALLVGEELLAVFGIGIPAFRAAGGVIILGIALAMLKADEPSRGDAKAAEAGRARRAGIAVVPLAIPLTIGPGAIAIAIVFAHQIDDPGEFVTLAPVVLAVCALIWLGLRFAGPIERSPRRNGDQRHHPDHHPRGRRRRDDRHGRVRPRRSALPRRRRRLKHGAFGLRREPCRL